jgi:hypothetical protein
MPPALSGSQRMLSLTDMRKPEGKNESLAHRTPFPEANEFTSENSTRDNWTNVYIEVIDTFHIED